MQYDQLTNLMSRGVVLSGFQEAIWPPPFLPTYKRRIITQENLAKKDDETEQQLSSSSESAVFVTHAPSSNNVSKPSKKSRNIKEEQKKLAAKSGPDEFKFNDSRVPSFTDRILFQTSELSGTSVECLQYESIDKIYSSDHKPVYSLFTIRLGAGGPNLPCRVVSDTRLLGNYMNLSKSKRNLSTNGSMFRSATKKKRRPFFIKKISRKLFSPTAPQPPTVSSLSASLSSLSIDSISSYEIKDDQMNMLNIGMFDQMVYLGGLKLRNHMMQIMTEPVKPSKNRSRRNTLYKSLSLDSNIIKHEHGQGHANSDGEFIGTVKVNMSDSKTSKSSKKRLGSASSKKKRNKKIILNKKSQHKSKKQSEPQSTSTNPVCQFEDNFVPPIQENVTASTAAISDAPIHTTNKYGIARDQEKRKESLVRKSSSTVSLCSTTSNAPTIIKVANVSAHHKEKSTVCNVM